MYVSQKHHLSMYRFGMTNPVKITKSKIKRAAGTSAWNSVRDDEAMVRKIIDMDMTVKKEIRRKKKK
jgi:hypothetical protein